MPDPENRLIQLLSRAERARLMAHAEPVNLVLAEVLCEAGEPSRHVYFPTAGFISLVTRIDQHPGLEVGMVGPEGMLGVQVALNVLVSPLRALVQGPGSAIRIGTAAFRRELRASPGLRRALDAYLAVLLTQLSLSSACIRFHQIGPRLARWLLMSQDRSRSDRFQVTHEFLAYMLGVRRVGVTMAAGELQRAGLIHYHRGQLTVFNRPGLEAAACSCYAAGRQAYSAHIPDPA